MHGDLVPIRIDLQQVSLRETFCFDRRTSEAAARQFANVIAADAGLPSGFAGVILKSIIDQITAAAASEPAVPGEWLETVRCGAVGGNSRMERTGSSACRRTPILKQKFTWCRIDLDCGGRRLQDQFACDVNAASAIHMRPQSARSWAFLGSTRPTLRARS